MKRKLFDKDEVIKQLLNQLSEVARVTLTIDDVGAEAIRLNYDDIDLVLFDSNVIDEFPLWMVAYLFQYDSWTAYAITDDTQHWIVTTGLLKDGKSLLNG